MNKSIVLYLLLAGLLTCFSCTHTKQQPEEEGVDSEWLDSLQHVYQYGICIDSLDVTEYKMRNGDNPAAIFSALGFYPVNPASGEYVIGSPTVDHAEIMLPGGKKFTIVVKRKGGAGAAYVKSVKLNGHKLDGYVLKHADIMKGGTLEFEMVARPKGKVLNLR